MKTTDFDYNLPPEFIAQTPVEPRDAARLLVMDRQNQSVTHSVFDKLGDYLIPGDLLVLNETRVIPARLFAHKLSTGGRIEILLLRRVDDITWETLVGGKGLVAGKTFEIENGPSGEIIRLLDGARRLVRFDQPIEPFFEQAGHVPLPPYIHTNLDDPNRYQTVYAQQPGSAAAPTAGMHFTMGLIDQLRTQGVRFVQVVLHIGLDTFAPVTEVRPEDHRIHTEWCQIGDEAAEIINSTRREGKRIIAVGTTSVRALESAARMADSGQTVKAYEGPTDLFILPGYQFCSVDAMITNFHLPRSTLIMLVSAFAGREQVLEAYQIAKETGYRFYSFGDAMLIL